MKNLIKFKVKESGVSRFLNIMTFGVYTPKTRYFLDDDSIGYKGYVSENIHDKLEYYRQLHSLTIDSELTIEDAKLLVKILDSSKDDSYIIFTLNHSKYNEEVLQIIRGSKAYKTYLKLFDEINENNFSIIKSYNKSSCIYLLDIHIIYPKILYTINTLNKNDIGLINDVIDKDIVSFVICAKLLAPYDGTDIMDKLLNQYMDALYNKSIVLYISKLERIISKYATGYLFSQYTTITAGYKYFDDEDARMSKINDIKEFYSNDENLQLAVRSYPDNIEVLDRIRDMDNEFYEELCIRIAKDGTALRAYNLDLKLANKIISELTNHKNLIFYAVHFANNTKSLCRTNSIKFEDKFINIIDKEDIVLLENLIATIKLNAGIDILPSIDLSFLPDMFIIKHIDKIGYLRALKALKNITGEVLDKLKEKDEEIKLAAKYELKRLGDE